MNSTHQTNRTFFLHGIIEYRGTLENGTGVEESIYAIATITRQASITTSDLCRRVHHVEWLNTPLAFTRAHALMQSLPPRKRLRQFSVSEASTSTMDHFPELPALTGDIILETFTHKSLRFDFSTEQSSDNERLSK